MVATILEALVFILAIILLAAVAVALVFVDTLWCEEHHKQDKMDR
jgi:hypothetical protein